MSNRHFVLFSVLLCVFILVVAFTTKLSLTPVHAGYEPTPSANALFHDKGCEYCHGVNGVGVRDRGPSLLTVGKHLKKDAIAKQIHDGGNGMPAFGDTLQPDEIKALVDMLAKKKKAPKGFVAPVWPAAPHEIPSQ
jgi:cytochrome c5